MKIVDNREQREQEIQKQKDKNKKVFEAAEIVKREAVIPKIGFHTDWRVQQEYGKLKGIGIAFAHEVNKKKWEFLEFAIKNRVNLEELIIEEHAAEDDNFNDVIEIEVKPEVITSLQNEARKSGLTLEQYVRAIYYSTAFQINEKERKKELEIEEYERINKPQWTEGYIPVAIKRKLVLKYGEPRVEHVYLTLNKSAYLDLLIKLAEEYFDNNKDQYK